MTTWSTGLGADPLAQHIVLEDGASEPQIKKYANALSTPLDINKKADSVFRLGWDFGAVEMLDKTIPTDATVVSGQRTVLIGKKHVNLVVDQDGNLDTIGLKHWLFKAP